MILTHALHPYDEVERRTLEALEAGLAKLGYPDVRLGLEPVRPDEPQPSRRWRDPYPFASIVAQTPISGCKMLVGRDFMEDVAAAEGLAYAFERALRRVERGPSA